MTTFDILVPADYEQHPHVGSRSLWRSHPCMSRFLHSIWKLTGTLRNFYHFEHGDASEVAPRDSPARGRKFLLHSEEILADLTIVNGDISKEARQESMNYQHIKRMLLI